METRNARQVQHAAAVRCSREVCLDKLSTLPRHNVAHITASANSIRRGSKALFGPHPESAALV